jgi:adenylate kinase family enzyme
VIHLDAYYWQPGWQETEQHKWLARQQELIKGDRWIIDGNYGSTMDIRLARSNTIIWLDFNRYVCLWRVKQIIILQNPHQVLNLLQQTNAVK